MDSLRGLRILCLHSCKGVASPVEGMKEPPGLEEGGEGREREGDRGGWGEEARWIQLSASTARIGRGSRCGRWVQAGGQHMDGRATPHWATKLWRDS